MTGPRDGRPLREAGNVGYTLKVSRGTWWGYPLHLVADNIRFPFTAVGMRVDLNRGKWHGPNHRG